MMSDDECCFGFDQNRWWKSKATKTLIIPNWTMLRKCMISNVIRTHEDIGGTSSNKNEFYHWRFRLMAVSKKGLNVDIFSNICIYSFCTRDRPRRLY